MDAHRAGLYTRTLRAIRTAERKSVPLHRASWHAWIDITLPLIEGIAYDSGAQSTRVELTMIFLVDSDYEISLSRRRI